VVDVVNRWFECPKDAFGYQQGDEDPLPFQPVKAKGRSEVFTTRRWAM
jgi:exodeoxyribonuclease V beta subunit